MDHSQIGEALLLGANLSIVKERVSWTLVKTIRMIFIQSYCNRRVDLVRKAKVKV